MQGFCNGANDYSVGRAATYRVKDNEGQCSDNSDTGSWYSHTAGAQCQYQQELGNEILPWESHSYHLPNLKLIGDQGCAWKQLEIISTISVDCLESLDFVAACTADPTMPYNSASRVTL